MNFTELIFLVFLIATLFLFYRARRENTRCWILLIASYLFYGWWDFRFLSLIIISSSIDYYAGQAISKSSGSKRRYYLILSLVSNLGILGFFKYYNFFTENFQYIINIFGINTSLPVIKVILPVGISFYTFQSMSYSLDIYRDKLKPTSSKLHFFTFVSFFPQLVAGPIVRAKTFLPQLRGLINKKLDTTGVFYILYGIFKKIVVADLLATVLVDEAFRCPIKQDSLTMILAIYGYAFQIFLDFSAYSDIAIGIGRLFGFTLPINFKSPYFAINPKEFWSRWHISFSTWIRDYLYIPLGGNRVDTKIKLFRNLIITMLLAGLWHGAGWNFIIWGFIHGFYLIIYRNIFINKITHKIPRLISGILFFNLICFAWIFFRSNSLSKVYEIMLTIGKVKFDIYNQNILMWILLIFSVYLHFYIEPIINKISISFDKKSYVFKGLILYLWAMFLIFIHNMNVAQKAFIYFQF